MKRLYSEFGRVLKERRKNARLTQQDLAKRIGLSRTSITNIELGRQQIPLHVLYALASAIGASPQELLPANEFSIPAETTAGLDDLIARELAQHDVDDRTKQWLERIVHKAKVEPTGALDDAETARSKGIARSRNKRRSRTS